MANSRYSKYQLDAIEGYYEHLDTIMLQRLQELVTELYLEESDKKKKRLWERAHNAMCKLKIHPTIIDQIMKSRDVEILAKNVQDWLKTSQKKTKRNK